MIINLNDRDAVEWFQQHLSTVNGVVGMTSGGWDLFHYMHLVYLERCRRRCALLIVGVDSDDTLRNGKGDDRPFVPEHMRMAIVDALRYVGAVFIMEGLDDWRRALDLFQPNRVFKNDEFKPEDVIAGKAEIVIIPDVYAPLNTTGIAAEIARRYATKV